MATHSATPQEDIGSILERFQQWTGDQSRPAAASDPNAPLTGFQRSAHQAYSSTRQMTRELSYDEALSRVRSRTRRPWEDEDAAEPAQPTAPAPAPATEAKTKAPAAASGAKSRKPSKAAEEKSALKTATSSTATRSQTQAKTQPAARKSAAPRKAKASGKKAKSTKVSSTAKTAAAAKKPQPAAQLSSAPYHLQPSPSFQQILAAQIKANHASAPASVPEVVVQPTTVHAEEISGTAVTVTVHLSVTERAALRTRAQQLGLTADAYLRQCALEVESLRSELQELLVTRMQAARELPAQPRRDWLGRLKQYFFPSRTDCQTQIFHA